jgi:hypothetical protein
MCACARFTCLPPFLPVNFKEPAGRTQGPHNHLCAPHLSLLLSAAVSEGWMMVVSQETVFCWVSVPWLIVVSSVALLTISVLTTCLLYACMLLVGR